VLLRLGRWQGQRWRAAFTATLFHGCEPIIRMSRVGADLLAAASAASVPLIAARTLR